VWVRAEDRHYTFLRLDVVDGDTMHEANTVTTTLLDLRGAVLETQALTKRATALLDGIMDAFVRK
jgi:hypothetical protein